MNKNYTLKELANFGQMSAHMKLDGRSVMHVDPDGPYFEKDRPAREAFTKAILDAIGYEFPKNEEREAFDAWWKANRIAFCNEEHAFQLWKAGREELRQAINKPSYSTPEQIDESIQNLTTKEPAWILDKQPVVPAWIPWHGGKCPIPETTKRKGLIPEYPGSELFCCVPLLSKCPIPEDTKCEVKFRNGETDIGPAKRFDWDHAEEDHDIIAYRILD